MGKRALPKCLENYTIYRKNGSNNVILDYVLLYLPKGAAVTLPISDIEIILLLQRQIQQRNKIFKKVCYRDTNDTILLCV